MGSNREENLFGAQETFVLGQKDTCVAAVVCVWGGGLIIDCLFLKRCAIMKNERHLLL